MKILLPIVAAFALSACGTNTAGEDNSVTSAGTNEVVPADPMANEATGNTAMTGTGGAVTVTINGVAPNGGPVLVALQDSASFAKVAGTYSTTVQPTGASVTATFQGVTPGTYAAAVVQDTNQDGTLTLGSTGPSETFGFSGTPQTGAPAFEPASFQVAETGGTATVTLTPK